MAALGPGGYDVSVAQAAAVHNIDNYVVFDEHCGGFAVDTKVVIFSAVLPGPLARA